MNVPADTRTSFRIELGDRTLGRLIGGATLLAIAIMAHHPTVAAHTMPNVVAEVAREAALNRFVHGAPITLLGVLLFAFREYSGRAGMDRPLVRAALLAYAIGVAASMGAALVSGLVAPAPVLGHAEAEPAALESLRPLLRLCWHANQALAKLGELGRGLGVVLWSLAMLRVRSNPVLGAFGVATGGLPGAALLLGALRLDLHGAMMALLAGAAWSLALATQLLRGRA